MSTDNSQKLLVFQSLWAMERRHTDGFERSLEENVRMIAEAGFDGISGDWRDRDKCRRMSELMKAHNLTAEGQCFPKTIDDLKPALENATEFRLHHLDIQPDIRPRKLNDCIPLIEGWRRLAEEVDFPVYIETHRDRMTTDLFFVLDLLDCFPDLKLLADLSHFLVGREFAWPIDEENHSYIHAVLDHSWAFHGRVASREQVQIEISLPAPQDVARSVPRLVGIRFSELAEAGGRRRHLRLHLRVRAETLRHHRTGRQRHHRPLGRGAPVARSGPPHLGRNRSWNSRRTTMKTRAAVAFEAGKPLEIERSISRARARAR